MINVIGRLRIELPGRQMLSEQECSEQLTEDGVITTKPVIDNMDYQALTISTKTRDKKTHKDFYKKETVHVYTRKCIPAIQSMPIIEDFYQGCMETPIGTNLKQWKKLPENVKLTMHMTQIAESFKGKFMDYTLFE